MIKIFARTDAGRVRKGNEDSFLVIDTINDEMNHLPQIRETPFHPYGIILMVSDGMGGAAAGEVASNMAVKTVRQEMKLDSAPSPQAFIHKIDAALQKANIAISEHARTHPEMRGMGATATIVGVLEGRAYIGQIGDSRAYLIRQGGIYQKTKDQSFVNQLVEAGKITEEEAEQHPRRNVILQALGNQANLEVALTEVDIYENDYLLICSDGLSGMVRKEEMLDIVQTTPGLDAACDKLVNLANERGGHDNITVILAHFSDETLNDPEEAPPESSSYKFYPSIKSYLKKLKFSPAGITKFFGKAKKMPLFILLATIAGFSLLWFGANWYKNSQRSDLDQSILALKNTYTDFRNNYAPQLQNLPNLPDSAFFATNIQSILKSAREDSLEKAAFLVQSAKTDFEAWRQRAMELIALKNGDQQYLEPIIREIWLEKVMEIRATARITYPEVQTFNEDKVKYIQSLAYPELEGEIRNILDEGYWQVYKTALEHLNVLLQVLEEDKPAQDYLEKRLEQSNEFHKMAIEEIFDKDPQIVKKGFKREKAALNLLVELKKKWLEATSDVNHTSQDTIFSKATKTRNKRFSTL